MEQMPEWKPPGLLIADADEGQVLALMTIACIKDLTKASFQSRTIKGKKKQDAMKKMAEVPPSRYGFEEGR